MTCSPSVGWWRPGSGWPWSPPWGCPRPRPSPAPGCSPSPTRTRTARSAWRGCGVARCCPRPRPSDGSCSPKGRWAATAPTGDTIGATAPRTPERLPMAPKRKATIIALANQKGGVAKTTSVASLGAAFAEQGRRVLLVDLDPQACLTFSLGVDPDTVESSVHDVLVGGAEVADVIVQLRGGHRPRAEHDRPRRRRGGAPVAPGPRVRAAVGARRRAPRLRHHPARLLPEPGRAHPQRPHRGPGPDHPDAVRDARSPRRRPAARHRARRQAHPQQEAAGHRHPPDAVRRSQQPLARGARRRR